MERSCHTAQWLDYYQSSSLLRMPSLVSISIVITRLALIPSHSQRPALDAILAGHCHVPSIPYRIGRERRGAGCDCPCGSGCQYCWSGWYEEWYQWSECLSVLTTSHTSCTSNLSVPITTYSSFTSYTISDPPHTLHISYTPFLINLAALTNLFSYQF